MHADDMAEVVTDDSHVRFEPFFSRPEGDWHLVGWPDRDVFVQLPTLGMRALELLREGLSVHEAQDQLVAEGLAAANVLGFVRNLARRGLVASIDGQPVHNDRAHAPAGGIPLLTVAPRYVRWLFSLPLLGLYGVLALLSGTVLANHRDLVPTSSNWFFLPWYGVNIFFVYLTNIVLVFVHELGHCTAARAFGLEARLGLSRRLYEPVAVTKIVGIWRLPRRQRAIVNSAGIVVNVCLFAAAVSLVSVDPTWLPSLARAWLRAAMVTLWVSTGWQFSLYMRTDVYYLIADLLGARNLMDDARRYIRHVLARVQDSRHRPGIHARPGGVLTAKDRRRRVPG